MRNRLAATAVLVALIAGAAPALAAEPSLVTGYGDCDGWTLTNGEADFVAWVNNGYAIDPLESKTLSGLDLPGEVHLFFVTWLVDGDFAGYVELALTRDLSECDSTATTTTAPGTCHECPVDTPTTTTTPEPEEVAPVTVPETTTTVEVEVAEPVVLAETTSTTSHAPTRDTLPYTGLGTTGWNRLAALAAFLGGTVLVWLTRRDRS